MNYQNSPNLFILLDIDPNKPWNQIEFERRINEMRSDWSKLLNHPTKGLKAKYNLALIPKFQEVTQDETQREQQAIEARTLKNQEQADRLQVLSKELDFLQAKGHILEEELMNLVTKYKGVASEAKIRQQITVPLRKETDRVLLGPVLDPTIAEDIRKKLHDLNKSDLYDFLGMSPITESRLLLQQAVLLYTSTQNKANKTFEDTYTAGLAGHCRAIFSSDTERAKYDETLRLQGYEEIKQKVNIAGAVTKVIHAAQVELLLHEAKEKGLDLNEARSFILDYARKKGFVVVMYEPKQADRLQNLEDELKLMQAKGHILEDELKLMQAKIHLLEEEMKSLTSEYAHGR